MGWIKMTGEESIQGVQGDPGEAGRIWGCGSFLLQLSQSVLEGPNESASQGFRQWLMPVILAPREAEIRRIAV
jgi:hypothetical protein